MAQVKMEKILLLSSLLQSLNAASKVYLEFYIFKRSTSSWLLISCNNNPMHALFL
jgi:hypothetical protein